MKKFLFLVMAALILGSTITGCKVKSQADKINDSIAQLMGKMEGADLKAQFQNIPDLDEQLDKDQYLKGMMSVIKMDTTKSSKSYILGLQQGLRVYQELAQLEVQGINVDRRLFLNEFKKMLDDKKPIDINMTEMQTKLYDLQTKSLNIKAQENLAAGKKYIDELMKKDNGYKKTNSGIIYKIVEQGSGESFNDASVVDIKLLLKDMNGNVYQNISKPRSLPLAGMKQDPIFANLYDIVKGMKPGAKVIAVIPGDQSSSEMRGLSPNLTFVVEITTVGLSKNEERPAPSQYPGGRNAQSAPQPAPQPAAPQPAPKQDKQQQNLQSNKQANNQQTGK